MADGHHIRNIVFDDNSVMFVRFSQNVAWRTTVMTAECHKFQCSKIQNGGQTTVVSPTAYSVKWNTILLNVESSYAVADWTIMKLMSPKPKILKSDIANGSHNCHIGKNIFPGYTPQRIVRFAQNFVKNAISDQSLRCYEVIESSTWVVYVCWCHARLLRSGGKR